ncbi:MAG: hypothetical protein CMN78_00100 [Spirochaetales bacterium]|nr:hypothetical protein [Spirochaetales bacterium]
MSVFVKEKHLHLAERMVEDSHANNGLAPLDLERFWIDQEKAVEDPFSYQCPQMPLGVTMSNECAFTELNVPEDWYRLAHEDEYRTGLEQRYNDISEEIVGRRLLRESTTRLSRKWPGPKKLNEIFDAPEEWHSWSYWIMQAATNPSELEALLDKVEKRLERLGAFILPDNWEEEKSRLDGQGASLPLYRGQRGPVTFAMSVYGVENLIYLIMDHPDLAARFRDLIIRAILERARLIDEEAGFDEESAPHGWSWADDNCAMLNAELYDFFAYPIVKAIFDRYCPDEKDTRGQHSDSDMGHLLPILGRTNLTWTNFGPNVTVSEIRNHLPAALIRGQLAPFTLSRNEEVNLVAETLRDFEMSQEKRGIIFSTAGSINNGSRLTGMRLIMATIQKYCSYA